MRVRDLLLINYRNYVNERLAFHPSLTILVGENAQGKTNLLESLYLCARGDAFRNARDGEIIRFGERSAYARARIDLGSREKVVEIKLSHVERKRIRVNEVEIENRRELQNQFDVVLFSPDDLLMIKDGPVYRRQYLDEVLRCTDAQYVKREQAYRRVLQQRNALLKRQTFGTLAAFAEHQLDAMDALLAEHGSYLWWARRKATGALRPLVEQKHRYLSHREESFQIEYVSNAISEAAEKSPPNEDVPNEEPMPLESACAAFLARIRKNRETDIALRSTEIGVHRDELALQIDGKSAKRYGSQGQIRTAVLALRLAELEYIARRNASRPILLLDDVFSELDAERARRLLRQREGYQTVITTNDTQFLQEILSRSTVYRVRAGKITEVAGKGTI